MTSVDPRFFVTNRHGEPAVRVSFSVEELDEIVDCLKFAWMNDPECDREFNAELQARAKEKRRRLRRYVRHLEETG